jgi:hypothetical protein
MKKAAPHTTSNAVSVQPSFGLGSLGVQFLDTTWRMATPVLLLTLAGIWCDKRWGTKPWLTLVSVLLGFGVAAWLVKLQLDRLNARMAREDKSGERES